MQFDPSRLLDLLAQNLRHSLVGLRTNLLRNRFLHNHSDPAESLSMNAQWALKEVETGVSRF
jgi:hypothetical protein